MNPTPLADLDVKFDRALTHIKEVIIGIGAFARLQPFSVRVIAVDDHGTPSHELSIVDNHVGAPDVSIALAAGEAAYQLRSMLDHLIHKLVALNGNAHLLEKSRRHQFPVFETSAGYRSKAGDMIVGVSEDGKRLIESVQPFVRRPANPRHDPLWILSDLNNTDKHRVIPVVVVGGEFLRVRDSADDSVFADLLADQNLGPLYDGKPLFLMPAEFADRYVVADVDCTVSFSQVSTDAGFEPSISSLLMALAVDAAATVRLFAPMFGEAFSAS